MMVGHPQISFFVQLGSETILDLPAALLEERFQHVHELDVRHKFQLCKNQDLGNSELYFSEMLSTKKMQHVALPIDYSFS